MYSLFSADDHIVEPPDLWTTRAPRRFAEDVPHVVVVDGIEQWLFDGALSPTKGLDAAAGRDISTSGREPVSFAEMRAGCYDPVARVADFDVEGIVSSVGFPSFPRLSGQRFNSAKDKGLAAWCVSAWNDFILDEWCATAPGRYVPLILGPMWDPDGFAQEIRRCADKGARAVSLSENPSRLGLPSVHSEYWDPVWAAMSECEVACCMHVGSSGTIPHPTEESPRSAGMALVTVNAQSACVDLLMSRVFREFPTLNVVLSESGAGWVPHVLDRADRMWARHGRWAGLRSDMSPSDVFRQNIWVSFIDDEVAIGLRHAIGVDRLLWECDYPHSDSSWPDSQRRLVELMRDVPADERDAMLRGNAERVFRWSS